MQDKLKAMIQSRRFWIAVSGILAVISNDLGITDMTPEQIQNVTILLASWILGDSIRETGGTL
jgi:hypothetical protein